jgi:hypothetical protein
MPPIRHPIMQAIVSEGVAGMPMPEAPDGFKLARVGRFPYNPVDLRVL